MRRLAVPAILVAGMVAGSAATDSAENVADGVVNVAIETAVVHAEWRAARSDQAPPLRRVVDEPTGRPALEYAETSPLKARLYYVDLDRDRLAGADTLQFAYREVGAPARVMAIVHGYPRANDQRRYYLHKRPQPHGQWQQVWLDLHHDDDGDWFEAADDLPDGKVRVALQITLHDMGETEGQPRVVMRFADVRLVRHPLRLTGDLQGVEMVNTAGRVGSRYELTLTNRSDQPQKARLLIDDADLDLFAVELSPQELTLGPGQSTQITARITAPAEKAAKMPALAMERAPVFATTESAPDRVTPWHTGYLLYYLTGAVPPPVDTMSAPWLYSDAERRRALQRATQHPRAGQTLEKMVAEAEELLQQSPEPPGEGSLHGNPNLLVHPEFKSQMRFHSPGKVWVDNQRRYLTDDERAALTGSRRRALGYAHHSHLASGAKTLGLAWWLTGRQAFAEHAAKILLAYADRYPDWPRNKPGSLGFSAKVGMGVLQESWWFRPLPQAFDLVRGAGVLSDEQDRRIVDGLMVPVMVTIRRHRIEANQQAEANAAMGLGALLAERWDICADTIHSGGGLRAQWRNDFDADGYTSERDMAYHFAAVIPFVELASAYEHVGVDLFDRDFKRLFDAPVAYAPDQRPAGPPDVYLTAYEHYRDPAYLPRVRDAMNHWSLEAMTSPLDPEAIAERADEHGLTNSVLDASGYTVLRSDGTGELVAVTMNWGSPSKRNGRALFDTRALWHGRSLTIQTGRIGYGYKQHRFSYTPVACNTVVVDGRNHSLLRAEQVAMLEGDLPAARWLSPVQRPLYDGVQWARTAAIVGNTVVIIDQIQSDEPRRFDWVTYPGGKLSGTTIDGKPASWSAYPALHDQGVGYDELKEPQITPVSDGPATVDYGIGDGASAKLTLLGSTDQLIRAKGWANWHPRQVPMLMQRAERSREAWFAGAYTAMTVGARNASPAMRRLQVTANGHVVPATTALAVQTIDATGRYIVLTAAGDGEVQVAGRNLRGPLAVVRLGSD